MAGPQFANRVRTCWVGQPESLSYIDGAGDAIRLLRGLLPKDQEKPHWREADCYLSQAVDCPENPTLLGFAEIAFRNALWAEGWLMEESR